MTTPPPPPETFSNSATSRASLHSDATTRPNSAAFFAKLFPLESIPLPILPRVESTVHVIQLLNNDGVLLNEANPHHRRDRYYSYYSKDAQKLISNWNEMDRKCIDYKTHRNKLIQELKAKNQQQRSSRASDHDEDSTTGTSMKILITAEERHKLAVIDAWYRGCLAFEACPERMHKLRLCWLRFMEANQTGNTANTTTNMVNIVEACKHKTEAVEACAGAKVQTLLLKMLLEQQA
jgi:hypothetical protein